jgi:PAP2 superfamily protein
MALNSLTESTTNTLRGRTAAAGRELGLIAAGYVIYTLARLLADKDQLAAMGHAAAMVPVEKAFGIAWEPAWNALLAAHQLPSVIASYWYATLHYLVTPIVLLLLWKYRPESYSRARTALVVATGLALAVYISFPVAPPRLMGGGYIDVLADTSHWGWWGADASAPRGLGGSTNELAAMPSMHVGWAVWSAWGIGLLLKSNRLRWLAWLYPIGTSIVVVATGNHWTLDVLGGAALVVLALGWTKVLEGEPRHIVEADCPT